MNRLIFDCETNGLLDTMDTVHSLVLKDPDAGAVLSCCECYNVLDQKPDVTYMSIEDGLRLLMEADQVIGHNIINFDIPALRIVYPWFKIEESKALDTLIISRLIWPEIRDNHFKFAKKHPEFPKQLIGSHGLEAWGHILGLHKGDYSKEMKAKGLDPWAAWNIAMQDYCELDVEVTHALLLKIEAKEYSQQAIELEHKFAWVIWKQEQFGFPFNSEKAFELHRKLLTRRLELEQALQEAFPPWEVKTPFVPKANNKSRGYVKGQLTYKTKQIVFNAGSRDHIADRLKAIYGWTPSEFTTNGKPKIDETTLDKLEWPEAKLLNEYLMIQKRLGMLAEGRNAWLKMVLSDGRIHGRVITNGAVTGRCTHRNPNVAQTPSVRAPYGHECRELFYAPEGWKLVGADASGLELRCLGHFMAKYDAGAYVAILLNGDIHTVNQLAAGLPTRDNAKTFIYAFLYGAGDEKIGSIVLPLASPQLKKQKGKALKSKFLKETPALKRLREEVAAAAKRKKYLKGLDGRRLHIRSAHAALNTLLQSAGALIVKQATVFFYEELTARGYVFGVDYALVAHVHDELQTLAREDIADEVGQVAVECIRRAGEHFGFRCPTDGEYKIGNNWADTH
ncbi:DNA polymerase-1 [Thalassospira sp. MBR-102]